LKADGPSSVREIETTLDTIGRPLLRHVRSEERDLFERIQKHLTEAELDALVPGLEIIPGKDPPG